MNNYSFIGENKKMSSPPQKALDKSESWVTGIRTQNDRTKTCSVTITP